MKIRSLLLLSPALLAATAHANIEYTLTSLAPLTGYNNFNGMVTAINDEGQLAGNLYVRYSQNSSVILQSSAFLYSNGQISQLNVPRHAGHGRIRL